MILTRSRLNFLHPLVTTRSLRNIRGIRFLFFPGKRPCFPRVNGGLLNMLATETTCARVCSQPDSLLNRTKAPIVTRQGSSRPLYRIFFIPYSRSNFVSSRVTGPSFLKVTENLASSPTEALCSMEEIMNWPVKS